ncbi:hypothetical protein L861_11110 [Litchfieldella anticariensis FP35 = DSM 16096]|uniref:Nicotinate phosphoribosyltransferase n=1 Tax=Litchfieldella anticariensis (strain DSM 16096 / CECT 5854 / CIP 108499 / LMG 22089 / FP35) TaxID=1121939 RepID=S2KGP5_LITA3|nr:nicotinate phosphoribosyltransferase [Halomonas anticariensis]EPC01115.1 hypothetical protein L861_11110 [Halomonas anticariensis FP35 = DSM 16096]
MKYTSPANVTDDDLALLTDLYELTMLQAYWREGMHERGVFSLYFRKLPGQRNFMLACGQQYVAELVTQLHFSPSSLQRLADVGMFDDRFLAWLEGFRFTGDIWALPEGTPVFPNEPLMEVEAPIAEAQLLESLVLNQVQLETVLASKAVRLVMMAKGRPIIDFGMRRMHGMDAAIRGVRAYRTAGLAGTSNVLGGLIHDLPLRGTMAHSYVLAHDNEQEAFREFARQFPGTTLLVDTHDTVAGVRKVIDLMAEEAGLKVGAVRLDSGDLGALARDSRRLLDDAGHQEVKIVASSGLDEYSIAELVDTGAPIDAFGVGTALGVSQDAPVIDLSYKLVEYAGKPRVKHSPGKINLPGRKQIYRRLDSQGYYCGDLISLRDETVNEGESLLTLLVKQGQIDEAALAEADRARERVQHTLTRLPPPLCRLESTEPSYSVELSEGLKRLQRETQ